jgi:hypothetical protein
MKMKQTTGDSKDKLKRGKKRAKYATKQSKSDTQNKLLWEGKELVKLHLEEIHSHLHKSV